MSHFFAYLNRMRLIKRWGLMRNLREENVQEHGLQVAVIAHGLALIEKKIFNKEVESKYLVEKIKKIIGNDNDLQKVLEDKKKILKLF